LNGLLIGHIPVADFALNANGMQGLSGLMKQDAQIRVVAGHQGRQVLLLIRMKRGVSTRTMT